MDKHCVSLEIAKQLKEVGWKKETEFWWVYNKLRDEHKICYGLSDCCKNHSESWEYYPAPLATEILEELPLKIKLCRYFSKDEYRCVDDDIHRNANTQVDSNPCNALALMWLYLRKEN